MRQREGEIPGRVERAANKGKAAEEDAGCGVTRVSERGEKVDKYEGRKVERHSSSKK